jgi:hypothetical protein
MSKFEQAKAGAAERYRSAPLPLSAVLVAAGVRVAVLSLVRRLLGWKRYPGGAPAICRAVIDDCWTGAFFSGSAGHFRQFWTRDLAMCTSALCRLGYQQRVVDSWAWALPLFERAGQVTTTIFGRRYPRDVYSFACDSLPMLLFGLRSSGATDLMVRHRNFLAAQVDLYIERILDPETGLVKKATYFSAPRDCMTGSSTVFANTMLALLERLLDEQDVLPNRLRGLNLPSRIREIFWCGEYFRDALDRDLPSGDANVWPFFYGIIADPEMKRSALLSLDRLGFTKPIPLRYFQRRLPESELPVPRLFAPNYQGDTSWMQMAPVYVGLLRDVDSERFLAHRQALSAMVERDGNYLELYDVHGRPYRGRASLYFADQGMLWAALLLDIL